MEFVEFHSIAHRQINWLTLTGEPLPISQSPNLPITASLNTSNAPDIEDIGLVFNKHPAKFEIEVMYVA